MDQDRCEWPRCACRAIALVASATTITENREGIHACERHAGLLRHADDVVIWLEAPAGFEFVHRSV